MKFLAVPFLALLVLAPAHQMASAEAKAKTDTEADGKKIAAATAAAKAPTSAKATPTAKKSTKPIPRTGPRKIFPVRVEESGRTMYINGWGLCEWGVFNWDLYWAALHLESKTKSAATMLAKDQAYRVHLHFARELTKDQMQKAYKAAITYNTGDNLEKYRKRMFRLLRMMRTVKEGDNLYFSYIPEKGMTVTLNDKRMGTLEGADWAKMFLNLYVGPNPPDKDLRKGLLGR